MRQPEPNLFIAFEALDAGGKTTQVRNLFEALGGITTSRTMKFPAYETPMGKMILEYLKGNRPYADDHKNALLLQSLMLTNRYEVVGDLLSQLHQGRNVVVDRYFGSGIAYGTADGLDPRWNSEIQSQLPMPDLYVYMDISVAESFNRRPERQDAYESDRGRLERVRTAYQHLWAAGPTVGLMSWRQTDTRWLYLDGTKPVEQLTEQLLTAVEGTRNALKMRG